MKDIGYVYDEVDGISRFYKEDLLELEFLTRVLGAGTEGRMDIKPLGITSEGLRVINILSNFAREVEVTGSDGEEYTITAVKELLYHIEKSTEQKIKLNEVYKTLSAKQLKTVKQVCEENQIVLPLN